MRSQIFWDVELDLRVTGARHIETPEWPNLQVLKFLYSCTDLLCDTVCIYSLQIDIPLWLFCSVIVDWSFLTAAL